MCTKKALRRHITALALATLPLPHMSLAQDEWVLEEIIITAQKRSESINEVGITVNAFGAEQIKELGITNATDMAQHTPGMTLSETGPTGVPVYTVRGMGFDDYSVASNSTVGVYINEVALPYPVMTSGRVLDVERIEVLKGAQGDLYGRNSTGGAINFVTHKPSGDFAAGLRLDYGRYDFIDVEAYISGALSNHLQGRLAMSITHQGEGLQKHLVTGETLGEKDKTALRTLLNWEASESLSVLLDLHASQDQSDNWAQQANAEIGALGGSLVPINPAELAARSPRDAAWSLQPEKDQDSAGVYLTVNWQLNHLMTLTSITAYDRFERDDTSDWDGTSLIDADLQNTTDIDSISQELRLSGDRGSVSWITGLYLSIDSVDEIFHGWNSDSATSFGLFAEVENRYSQDTDTRALFGHIEFDLSEQWRLALGARYTYEEREWQGCTYDVDGGLAQLYEMIEIRKSGNIAFVQGDCMTVDGFGGFENSAGFLEVDNTPFKDELTTENLSGKITLDYIATQGILIYGTIGTGFKSGGFNGAFANDIAQLSPYQEEETLSAELGIKATLLDSSLQLNSAVFYYDYRDKQLIDTTDTLFGPLTTTVNVPESEIGGAEIELQWRPLQGLDIKLGIAYLDTEVKKFDTLNPILTKFTDAKGADLPNAAQWQYNGLIGYEFPFVDGLRLRAVTDFSYTDNYYTLLEGSLGDVDAWNVEDYWLVNARLMLAAEDDSWEVALWGRNLEDKYYYYSRSFGNSTVNQAAGPGNTYGVSFSYRWK